MSDTFLQVTSFDPLIVSEPQGAQGPQGQIGPAGPPGGVISIDGQTGAVSLSGNYASINSPALTGTPTVNGAVIASTDDALAYAVIFGGSA
jgi:hypothetical protein